jgi:hypothetical protein
MLCKTIQNKASHVFRSAKHAKFREIKSVSQRFVIRKIKL